MKYCGGFSFFAAYCGSFEIAAHCTSLNDLIWMKRNIFVCFESDFFVCVFILVILLLFCRKKNCFNFIIWEMTFWWSCRYELIPPQKSHMKPMTIPKQMLDSKSYRL